MLERVGDNRKSCPNLPVGDLVSTILELPLDRRECPGNDWQLVFWHIFSQGEPVGFGVGESYWEIFNKIWKHSDSLFKGSCMVFPDVCWAVALPLSKGRLRPSESAREGRHDPMDLRRGPGEIPTAHQQSRS